MNKNLLLTGILIFLYTITFAEDKYRMVVAKDGCGDFVTIQQAIDASKAFPPQRITIFIKNGVYNEKVKVHSWNNNLSLIGESADSTLITWNDYFDKINLGRNSTFYTYTLMVEGNDFMAKNLTIENSAGPVGQAVALHVDADRCVFRHIRILGNQDALYAAGMNCRQYYKDCYIEGTTDFIFGAATALFDNCTIHSKSNSYITAASTPEGTPFGYVFRHCKLTASNEVDSVYLGRPWRKFAKTVFIECELGSHILPESWAAWSNADDKQTTYYAEYQNYGPGSNTDKRIGWSQQLTTKEAKQYTPENILKARTPKEDWEWMNR
ncbi:MAG TPA: pectinesterase family protein [Prolixibacteraceae bacterium]|nr:pectinesterase family protein [Prolixibacteraceae bacterium]HPS12930.1 pectinesterase family protein [Prolixibacteraceae bacterium]